MEAGPGPPPRRLPLLVPLVYRDGSRRWACRQCLAKIERRGSSFHLGTTWATATEALNHARTHHDGTVDHP